MNILLLSYIMNAYCVKLRYYKMHIYRERERERERKRERERERERVLRLNLSPTYI